MTLHWEVLDPRYDEMPGYWPGLRERAGLRADWDWRVLRAGAWSGRTPALVSVLRDAGQVCGVVSANWAGLPSRRNAFVSSGRGRWVGVLDVRSPGNSALPGWWWPADRMPTRELFRWYLRDMRRELGLGCRGVLWRQLSGANLPALAGTIRVVRPTESVALIHTAGWRTRDDWLATLSRNRRKNLRKIFRMVDEDPSIEVTVGPAVGVDPAAVAAVLRHNERKYHKRFGPLPQQTGYLAELLRQPDVIVIRYADRDTGDLLAVVTILDHPQWPLARHWSAVPVERGGRSTLYFHYYGAAVRWAVTAGKRGLVIGKGMAELKKTLGADLVAQYAAAVPVL